MRTHAHQYTLAATLLTAAPLYGLTDASKQLFDAIGANKAKKVKTALNSGASANAVKKGSSNTSALHYAAQSDRSKITKMLIKADAKIEAWDYKKNRQIHVAGPKVTKVLIKNKAYVNAKNADGNTPLHRAIKAGHTKKVKYLLAHHNIDIMILNNKGKTCYTLFKQRSPKSAIRKEYNTYVLRKNGK